MAAPLDPNARAVASPFPCVVFLTASGTDAAATLAESFREGEGWDPLIVQWPGIAGLDAARERRVAALVVVGPAPPEAFQIFAGDAVVVPTVAIGGPPPAGSQVTCWMPSPPTSAVLNALVTHLFRECVEPRIPRVGPAWRRKSDAIIGRSPEITQLLRLLDRLAPSSAPVLVTGESGTGKDLVARALHFGGPRASSPFIALNCAAIPEALFESELFGYERGAFTGAVTTRPGAFEAAAGGTIFLDEIAEAPPSVQAKLLRVLDNGEITRLGSSKARTTSVRVVAATNRSLRSEVSAGRFREDLFYRVSMHSVHVPPLRDRIEDVPAITRHQLSLIARREQRPVPRLSQSALEKLLSHGWPGNVRELIGTLERAFLLADADAIEAEQVVLPERWEGPTPITSYRDAKARFEAEYYAHVLRTTNGNITLAARLAKKTRKEVYDALKRLNLDAVHYRSAADNDV